MAIGARLRIEGIKEAALRIDEIGLRARRPEPALRSRGVLAELTGSERRLFASQRGWRRLTPKWVAYKRRHGLDPRILRATGKLQGALEAGRGNGITFRAWNAALWWGITPGRSDLYYAQALAKGVGHKKVKRRAVVIDRQAREGIAARVDKYVADGLLD